MAKVAVLAGGNSNERLVSLRSGKSVSAGLMASGHEVINIDPTNKIETYAELLKSTDVVFPALHGLGGEDGLIQAYFEAEKINFIGSGSESSKLCFNKHVYYKFLVNHGITMPETLLIDNEEFIKCPLTAEPFILKPNEGGSSIDNVIERDLEKNYTDKIRDVFERYTEMLIQPLIPGTEITVAVVGEKALPIVEIIPPANQEFDYENKYNGASQEICPPVHIDKGLQRTAQELALTIHKLCKCRHMSRTDMMVTPDGEIYVLETNTIPGLTDQSLLPKAAQAAGIDMAKLCNLLVKAALARPA